MPKPGFISLTVKSTTLNKLIKMAHDSNRTPPEQLDYLMSIPNLTKVIEIIKGAKNAQDVLKNIRNIEGEHGTKISL